MDSTQDSFTLRMLQRAASIRKSRKSSIRCNSDDSWRKLSILQAVDNKPVKIPNNADDKQRTSRRSSLCSGDDRLIPRCIDISDTHRRSRYSSSHLTGLSRSNADCQNSQKQLLGSLNYNQTNGVKNNKKQLLANVTRDRNYPEMKEKPSMIEAEYESNIDKNILINETITKPTTLKESIYYMESHDENKTNHSDFTNTFDSEILNVTGNSTKDSLTSSTYVRGFELGNVKWRGPLYKAAVKTQQRMMGDDPVVRSTSDFEEPMLLKAVHKEIFTPPKMRAELRTIDTKKLEEKTPMTVDNHVKIIRPNSIPLQVDNSIQRNYVQVSKENNFLNVAENLDSPTTPLSAEIKRLDEEIKRLELHPSVHTLENTVDLSPTNRIYPNLSEIHFNPTGYSPKKVEYESPHSLEENSVTPKIDYTVPVSNVEWSSTQENVNDCKLNTATFDKGSDATEVQPASRFVKNQVKSSVKNDKFKPNLESTRKSSFSDLSKNTASPSGARESTVSSVTTTEARGNTEILNDNTKPLDSTVPYDVDNFLADALGDELYNTTVTYPPSETHDKTISEFNASELISEDKTPLQKKNRKFWKRTPATEPPPQHTSTFNRTMTIYRSLTQRIKNKLRPGLKSIAKIPVVTDHSSVMTAESMSGDKRIQALLQEADIQHAQMYQAHKALLFCRSMKEFAASTELVESERSLLVASLRRSAALDEIKKLDSELNNNEDLSSEWGEVRMEKFSLPLKTDVLETEAYPGDFEQWFVVVVSYGPSVWATRPISCPVTSPKIVFPGGYLLQNLNPNFKITVRIYSLKMRRSTFDYDAKYRLNRTEKNSRCPSPKKLLKRNDKPLSPKQNHNEFNMIRNTSFVLTGMLELYLHDLSLTSPWPLTNLMPGTVLRGVIDFTFTCKKLHLTVSHAGFLTHGDEAGGFLAWNRRWCVLQGKTLMFWNYPCDQEDKKPLATIDLTNCISGEVTLVDRSLCAKPRTLLIETSIERTRSDRNSVTLDLRSSCTVVRNLLCCDTARDLTQWESKLNQVVSALRDWNVTSPPSQLQVSDL
ncbi:anillin-like [Athalia rosae]|uniref:anillin-like n=1 Tax=Athalia rosae TaxID=37344 RepID=UPI0020332B91|nr:anillin-like [Athalia rosae]